MLRRMSPQVALLRPREISDLSPQSEPKQTVIRSLSPVTDLITKSQAKHESNCEGPYLRIFHRICDLLQGEGHRFDHRFFRPFRADLSIRKSSSFLPRLIAATRGYQDYTI